WHKSNQYLKYQDRANKVCNFVREFNREPSSKGEERYLCRFLCHLRILCKEQPAFKEELDLLARKNGLDGLCRYGHEWKGLRDINLIIDFVDSSGRVPKLGSENTEENKLAQRLANLKQLMRRKGLPKSYIELATNRNHPNLFKIN